jgi:ATP-binding cassette subfamily B protein
VGRLERVHVGAAAPAARGACVAGPAADRLIASALADPDWRGAAALDAATRLVTNLVESGALRRRVEVVRALSRSTDRARATADDERPAVPDACWSVRPADSDADGTARVRMRGAVVVSARGVRGEERPAQAGAGPALPSDVIATLREAPPRPAREVLRILREDGALTPAVMAAGIGLAAFAVVAQGLLFRSLLDVGRDLATTGGRLMAIGALLAFLVAVLLVEVPVAVGLRRLGRGLETRLRAAFLRKIPRLPDRYFASRLNSDMAERSHALHQVRDVPALAGRVVRLAAQAVFVTAGLLWLAPGSFPLVLATAVLSVGLPIAALPALLERDLRARSHAGALSRFYLDALLGIVPIRTHGGEAAVRRAHADLLVEWARAALARLRVEVIVEGVTFVAGFAAATALLVHHATRGADPGSALLLAWWALALPAIGEDLGQALVLVPARRNVTLRLLEPLATPEEDSDAAPAVHAVPAAESRAMALRFEDVRVVAGGHVILDGIELAIAPGEHVAVVGPSGAGKSSLLGVLLGWHRPAQGRVLIEGVPLAAYGLERLRRETAWVDPAVQIWNRSLLENLRFGGDGEGSGLGSVVDDAELSALLERLPEGFQSRLGEGGALVSGGEGQRVRLARAFLRDARLVLLDEPFRGLDRDARRRLLARSRERWKDATLLCVTHDIGETRGFDRVVVVDGGDIVEDDAPEILARGAGRYAALLAAEDAVRESLWRGPGWRRLRLADGRLVEEAP